MLKFLVDQNIPKSVSLFLSKQKFNVKLVKSVDNEMTDKEVVRLALAEKRIILTNDRDFLDLGMRNKNANIIVFECFSQTSELRISLLKKVIPSISGDFGVLLLRE